MAVAALYREKMYVGCTVVVDCAELTSCTTEGSGWNGSVAEVFTVAQSGMVKVADMAAIGVDGVDRGVVLIMATIFRAGFCANPLSEPPPQAAITMEHRNPAISILAALVIVSPPVGNSSGISPRSPGDQPDNAAQDHNCIAKGYLFVRLRDAVHQRRHIAT